MSAIFLFIYRLIKSIPAARQRQEVVEILGLISNNFEFRIGFGGVTSTPFYSTCSSIAAS